MSERPKINFGPPQSYKEAVTRFPDDIASTPATDNLKELLASGNLDLLPLKRRMLGISAQSLRLMEQWSFRRNLDSVRKTGWDHFLPYYRVEPLSSVFKVDELKRELEVWTLKPGYPVYDNFILVCVRADPGIVSDNTEYLIGFLKHEEYYLLTGQKALLSSREVSGSNR